MMKFIVVALLVGLPILMKAQQNAGDSGIRFQKGLRWQEVLATAKAENKFIFLDCYTTWCTPCKAMDKVVYPVNELGQFMNKNFISVKFQMDTSKNDNDTIRALYKDAHDLKQSFKVNLFPTFLFYNSEGKLVHRDVGFKKKDAFLLLASQALDENKQYYTLLDAYKKGKRDYREIKYLALLSKNLEETKLALQLAKEYVSGYLDKLGKNVFCAKENFQFFESFPELLTSKSRPFYIYTHAPVLADSVVGIKWYSKSWIDAVVYKEEIKPFIDRARTINQTPDWKKMITSIQRKYGSGRATRLVLKTRISWCWSKKQWKEASDCIVETIEKFGYDSSGAGPLINTNNYCWNVIFLYCKDKKILEKAIEWMAKLLENPSEADAMQIYVFIDTYANLLYKAGRVSEAIQWEQRAVKLNQDMAVKYNGPIREELAEALQKMKAGEKTWGED